MGVAHAPLVHKWNRIMCTPSAGAPPTPDFIPPATLTWSHNDPAAVMYFVLILEAEDDVIVDVYNTSDSAVSLTGLQEGQYRARVRGVNVMGAEGPWSEFRIFTVQLPSTGVAPSYPLSHLPSPHTYLTPSPSSPPLIPHPITLLPSPLQVLSVLMLTE